MQTNFRMDLYEGLLRAIRRDPITVKQLSQVRSLQIRVSDLRDEAGIALSKTKDGEDVSMLVAAMRRMHKFSVDSQILLNEIQEKLEPRRWA